MIEMDGYFDGNTVRTFEPIVAKKNQKVRLTFLDEFQGEPCATYDDEQKAIQARLDALDSIFGLLDEDEIPGFVETLSHRITMHKDIDL